MPRHTSRPYLEILDQSRQRLFNALRKLPRGGILGGGTALALQIGHRRSFDFDFFYDKRIKKEWLRDIRSSFGSSFVRTVVDHEDELTVVLEPDIKLTLLHYPFPRIHQTRVIEGIRVFHLYDIATAKAYAIGRRGAWRDYVDLYFLLKKNNVSLDQVIKEAKKRFDRLFDEKLFLQQLAFFGDISDMSVDLIVPVSPAEIKKFLEKIVRDYTVSKIKAA